VTSLPTRALGALTVPIIGYGAMELAGAYGPADDVADDGDADRALDAALDAGCSFVDTSDSYGASEQQLARLLARRGRDAVQVSTKFGLRPPDGEPVHAFRVPWSASMFRINGEPRLVRGYAERSLRRLGTDVIDLYSPHFPDPEVPIEDTIGAVAELVSAGLVQHVGISNPTEADLRRAQTVHPIAAVQVQWSMWRPIEPELLVRCRDTGVGIVAWAPMGRGFLTGTLAEVGDQDYRRNVERLTGPNLATNNERFAPIRTIAGDLGLTPAQLALAWLLRQHPAVVPIPGSRTPAHIVENAAAASVALDAAALARIDAALADFVPAGDVS
jgi:aryl-alcohol dehydrogenase-like predicted oxidoreductase